MSTNNGIYILTTKSKDSTLEYRVAHILDVSRIHYNQQSDSIEDHYINPECLKDFFKTSNIYSTEEEAWERARKMEKEIMSGPLPELEHGICILDLPNYEFPE